MGHALPDLSVPNARWEHSDLVKHVPLRKPVEPLLVVGVRILFTLSCQKSTQTADILVPEQRVSSEARYSICVRMPPS